MMIMQKAEIVLHCELNGDDIVDDILCVILHISQY